MPTENHAALLHQPSELSAPHNQPEKGSVKVEPTSSDDLDRPEHNRRAGRADHDRAICADDLVRLSVGPHSPPKSVSVVALYQDVRIVELHDSAVRLAMLELETFAATRVRKSGQFGDRETGNVIGASFQHHTSRELDPHLHPHCVVINATFDPAENRWKALEAFGMYRAQKFAENYYYHELAKGLRLLGYELDHNARDFEIKGVPAPLIERFSKRHQQIDDETERRVEKEGLHGNVKALRKQVAHDKRSRKIKDSTASWRWTVAVCSSTRTAIRSFETSGTGKRGSFGTRTRIRHHCGC